MQSSQTSVTRTSTHRSVDSEADSTSYRPSISNKTVLIQRGSYGGGGGRRSMYGGGGSSFSSSRISANFSPAVYSQMAGTGIAGFRDTREKEKREMQDCNERLATYIEKVRWLEASNKKLEAENEALRKRKQEDWRPIKDMYESELNQAREVIKDLSTQKGIGEAKLAGLQDEIDSLKDLIGTYESNARDYAKKIDALNSQIGEYEGELNTLRLRVGSLEDEAAKLRALVNKYKEENARLRADLDAETSAHIEQEVLAQTRQEEVEFLQDLLDKLQLAQQEPVTIKGMDMEAFFKGEIRQAVQSIQQMYDEKLSQITMDCDNKLASQMDQLRSGNVRDTMEAEHAKTECKRLRDQLSERNARIAELESQLAILRSERDYNAAQLATAQEELNRLTVEHQRKMAEYQAQVEALMAQLNELVDAKMSLELEIACYKKLLEGEENRTGLRQLVEQTIGVRGGGASQLADMIGQSSMSTINMQMQKSRSGNLGIKELHPNGHFIAIELDGMARTGQDLRGVKLVRRVDGMENMSMDLGNCDLGKLDPGRTLTIYAKNSGKSRADSSYEYISTQPAFSSGDYFLMDGGREVASLRLRAAR